VEQLEAQLAELTERLEAERERLSRLVITRETAGELLARMTDDSAVDEPVRHAPSAGDGSPFEGVERRDVGVLSLPKWQPGVETSARRGSTRTFSRSSMMRLARCGPSR
jgi:hypothetical protein